MNSSRKMAGYDQEEKYFHDHNQKLIEARRNGANSKALMIRQPAKVLAFPARPTFKKAG